MTKKIFSIIPLFFLLTHFLLAQQTEIETIYFDSNKSKLTEEAKEILNKKLSSINIDEVLKITLDGHTDSDGSIEYNLTLSKDRCLAAKNFFISKGILKEKLLTEFHGESNPIAPNDNEQNKNRNRRVEVTFELKEIVVTNIFEKLKKAPQIFKSDPTKDITIKGKEGTIIKIPKNSLVDKKLEPIKNEVEIQLLELYKKSDILTSNVHTMSDNRLLETGGMIQIEAYYLGEILKLERDKRIEIKFNSAAIAKRMETFIGEFKNNQMNWVIDTSNYETIVIPITNLPAFDNEESMRNKYNRKDTATIKKLKKVDDILLTSGQLGWINCDRFYNLKDKTDLLVEVEGKYKPTVRLVFKDINSVMPGNHNENKITFQSIPVGQKATLIAFSLVNDEPFFVTKEIIIGKNQKESLILVKSSFSALKEDLEKLN